MSMKYSILFIVLCFSCGPKRQEVYVCTCAQRDSVKNFVERNIKPANNMADEEMEDVINELFRTGISLHCQKRIIETEPLSPFIPITKLDSCEFFMP